MSLSVEEMREAECASPYLNCQSIIISIITVKSPSVFTAIILPEYRGPVSVHCKDRAAFFCLLLTYLAFVSYRMSMVATSTRLASFFGLSISLEVPLMIPASTAQRKAGSAQVEMCLTSM